MIKITTRRYFNLLVVLVAVVSSAFAILAFRHAKKYYNELNAVRLDPLGLRHFRIPKEPKNPDLVFYGDSRAAQWSEPSWLAGRTLNLGMSGQTTEQILGRFDHHLAPFSPRIVVFQAGINDLKAVPLFPQAEDEIINNCKVNLQRIVTLCRQKNAHVVLTTIFPVGKLPLQRRVVWSARVDRAVGEVNSYIRSLASADVSVLVTADLLNRADGRLNPAFSHDFLHLNDQGVAQLNVALRKLAEPILESKPRHSPSEPEQAKGSGWGQAVFYE
jgi:lysophospholipase L1-like esterase